MEDIPTGTIVTENIGVYPCNLVFCNAEGEVGRLEFEGNEMRFKGNADESAKLFFDFYLKGLCDQYLANKVNGV